MQRRPSLIEHFIKDKKVASLASTSQSTVKHICSRINFDIGRVLVEYGPGTGVITDEIQRRMHEGAKLLAIELNHELASYLKDKYRHDNRLTICEGSAENVREILRSIEAEKADAIVSGIPFSFLSDEKLHELLTTTNELLADDGTFLAYQVRKMHTRKHLRKVFATVHETVAPFNIPPLWIFEMSKTKNSIS